MIIEEVTMKRNTFLALLLLGASMVASPLTLLADKVEKQCKHAATLLSRGDWQGVQSEIDTILKEKPGYDNAKVILALALTQHSEQSAKDGDRTRAVAELREALRLDPDEAYWRVALARLLRAQGDEDGAAKECSEAGQLSPDDSGLVGGCWSGPSRKIQKSGGTNPPLAGDAPPLSAGGEVTYPVPIKKPDPPYSDKARLARYQGTTVLWIVVSAEGEVEDEAVVKPLGLGLDELALRTVRTWTFKPATRRGVPVPVRVMVEVSFKLF
jgi:TonB family protein